IAGATAASYTATAAGSYTVTVTNSGGCSATSAATTVTVNSLPTAAITTSAPTTFCSGGSVVLTASAGSSYKWMNGSTAITGATSQTYTATTAGSYTVEVSNAAGCKATSTATTVTVNTAPNAPTVTSAVSYCQHATAAALTANGTGLKWYADNTTTTALSTAPTPATTTAGTTNYYVSQTSNGCESARAQITVTVNILPTVVITASTPTTFCTGGSATLTASAGSSYKWMNGTAVITGATAQTYTATAAGNYTVEVSNASGCKATSQVTAVTVNAAPMATITTTTSTTFCAGGSVTLNANTGTGLAYQWYNGTNTTGTGAASLSLYVSSGSFTVKITDVNGCTSTSAPVTVTINSLPNAPAVTSAVSYCQNGTAVALTATGTGLKWYADNTTTTALAGAPTPSTTAAGTTSYYVSQTTNGCESARAQIAVTVNTLPTAEITTSTATAFCAGGSVVLTASVGSSYKWMNGTTVITGATAQTYTATTAGSYTVEVTNAANCSATSSATVVTVNDLPLALITASGSTTIPAGGSVSLNANTGSGLTYKWFKGANQVGTAASYTATEAGVYTVEVTNAAGCSTTSAGTAVNINTNKPSQITITSPSTNTSVQGAITITADITDPDGSIVLVEYLDGNTVIGTSTSA
ncbi:hypothetical protein, partial [Flavobacterium sp.]|uniref:beta strand repeat-containing protein n=1 Tax=Flavobacterium sp. TaxID=239 RepID=UPI0025C43035